MTVGFSKATPVQPSYLKGLAVSSPKYQNSERIKHPNFKYPTCIKFRNLIPPNCYSTEIPFVRRCENTKFYSSELPLAVVAVERCIYGVRIMARQVKENIVTRKIYRYLTDTRHIDTFPISIVYRHSYQGATNS